MLPELILNGKYTLSEELVMEQIRGYDFRGEVIYDDKGFEVCRIGGYRFKEYSDGNAEMIGWQCNMADIQNYDIMLPTVISIKISSDNIIEEISLNPGFKGSQGIPCSYKYLNQRLQAFKGEKFTQANTKIQDPLSTGCRHTYEVLYGACVFREWCKENGCMDSWLTEATSAYQYEDGLIAIDRNSINGKESITKIDVSNFKDNIKYNRLGAIEKCINMNICGFEVNQGEEIEIGKSKVLTAENVNDFKLKLMKILSKYWIRSGKVIGVKNKFYFSQLWPTTFFGILSQMFAIIVFSNSYSYFQHCIQGLQKDEEHCACIGVCQDIDECMKYFSDFKVDFLF